MGDGGSTEPGVGGSPNSGRPKPDAVGRARRTVVRVLVRASYAAAHRLSRLLGESPAAGRAHISQAELRDLVAHSTALNGDERHLIDEVIAAGTRHVRELMVPRTEVVYLDASASVARAAELARETRHSRFPVIDGSHDDVVGFVHLRDLLIRPASDGVVTVGDLARPLRHLPASKRVLAALSEMRREGDHLALVVDEYGGTAGIVTLEDLIEELVGEIHDEYDATPDPAVDGAVPAQVDGLLNLNDFAERAGFALSSGPYDTVGGFVMASLGRLPAVGDEVAVPAQDGTWRLAVSAMDGRRVSRVSLDRVAPADGLAFEQTTPEATAPDGATLGVAATGPAAQDVVPPQAAPADQGTAISVR